MSNPQKSQNVQNNKFVMLLSGLDHNNADLVGNVYPNHGPIIYQNFRVNKNILNGYLGEIWGASNSKLHPNNSDQWIVTKVELSQENISFISKEDEFIKFGCGFICFKGNKDDAMIYMDNHKNDIMFQFTN